MEFRLWWPGLHIGLKSVMAPIVIGQKFLFNEARSPLIHLVFLLFVSIFSFHFF